MQVDRAPHSSPSEQLPPVVDWPLQLRQPSPVSGTSFDSTLSALAVAKRGAGALAVSQNKAEMVFDDDVYDRLPHQLAADNVPSQAGTGSNVLATRLTVYRPVADLAGGRVNPSVAFTAFNEAGQEIAGKYVLKDGQIGFEIGDSYRRHGRTTNPIESPFAAIRLRTNAMKRLRTVRSGGCI